MAERRILINNYHAPTKCDKCGYDLVFKGVGTYECGRCRNIQYDDYGLVRNYVEAHPGASVSETSLYTGVEEKQINTMLRDEKLEIASDSKVFLKCEGCGKEIRFGKYCKECGRLAAAAEARKNKEREARKKNLSGVAIGNAEGSSGAKRFERK